MPTNDYSKNIVYLSKEQYQELITNETLTVNGQTITYNDNDIYVTPQAEPITDVKLAGTSIGSNGVANIPLPTGNGANPGVVAVAVGYGIKLENGKTLRINEAPDSIIKQGTDPDYPIVSKNANTAAFYGLAKVAGHDEKDSTEPLGTYTDGAKAAIQNMLGITDLISAEESSTATAAHALNSTFMMDGKLHRATAAIAIGDAVEVGTNCEVVKADEVFVKKTDYADTNKAGVVKIGNTNQGFSKQPDGTITLYPAQLSSIKQGSDVYNAIIPSRQHYSVFYGLSKVAGVDLANETVTLGTYPETSKTAIRSLIGAAAASDIPSVPVQDVQVNGTSVVSDGVANIPIGNDVFGVVKVLSTGQDGVAIYNGKLSVARATEQQAKAGGDLYKPIVPGIQHTSAFYGLAKAAGDTTQASSSNAVGNYTDSAKSAIRNMLGAASPNVIAVQDEQPTDSDTKVWLPETEAQGIQVPTMEDLGNYVQKTDYANQTTGGVVKIIESGSGGFQIDSGYLLIRPATQANVKSGANTTLSPIVPAIQHESTFYGLAKAAGDTTQSQSDNAVGTYTDDAKAAIRNMLSVASITDLNNKADKNNAVFTNSISMGRKANTTIGETSVAVGNNVQASAVGTFAVGYQTQASSLAAFAEGNSSIANNQAAHAEGWYTTASGMEAHAEGYYTVASGSGSHAEGSQTTASGHYSHASGGATQSLANYSYTAGYGTIAHGICSFIIGKYNAEDKYQLSPEWVADTSYQVGDKIKITTTVDNVTTVAGYICKTANNDNIFTSANWNNDTLRNFVVMVGNGTTNNNQSNAYALDWNGNAYYAGNVYVGCNADSTGGIRLPHDVQINGTSVVSNGIANIPVANNTTLGLVAKGGGNMGIAYNQNMQPYITGAALADIKPAANTYKPIVPSHQHEAVFYGLAQAAGDTTMASSSNAVGTYTSEAKAAIHTMLGIDPASIAAQVDIPLVETVSGTTPTITGQPNVRYVCGEVSTISITPPASGSVDVIFESGSTATVLTVPNTVKWPAWFDATTLETDTTYEILITDGIYGSVMTWAT